MALHCNKSIAYKLVHIFKVNFKVHKKALCATMLLTLFLTKSIYLSVGRKKGDKGSDMTRFTLCQLMKTPTEGRFVTFFKLYFVSMFVLRIGITYSHKHQLGKTLITSQSNIFKRKNQSTV